MYQFREHLHIITIVELSSKMCLRHQNANAKQKVVGLTTIRKETCHLMYFYRVRHLAHGGI